MTDGGPATTDASATPEPDRDVVVVGGGPAGCAAAVFAARYGLDTLVFDRGNASLRQCAYLENYLGFPAGIDVETFYGLLHAHVDRAGGDLRAEQVTAVERADAGADAGADADADDGPRFAVETDEGTAVAARSVVAAAKYDGAYLRPLDDEGEMFERREHAGETSERFDRSYPDDDGRTPVDGLYVAGPLAGAGDQALIAAGHGASVARALIADERRADGYWDAVADQYDWVRRRESLGDEWRDRERWREWFDAELVPDDLDRSPETVDRVREEYVDAALATYLEPGTVEDRLGDGQRAVADHLDDDTLLDALDAETILDALDAETVLDALDDDRIRAYLDGE